MKKWVFLVSVAVMVFSFSSAALGDYFEMRTDNGEVVTLLEPEPYGGKSLQERVPFAYICVSPDTFSKAIQNAQSADTVLAYLQGLGLPVERGDAEFVYDYRNRMETGEFTLPKEGRYSRLMSVSFIYSRESNDNQTFLFAKKDSQWYLIDSIVSFGDISVLTDCEGENTWLVGSNADIGDVNRTIRWYHLQSTTMVLSYLEKGLWADHLNYHVHVETQVEWPEDGEIEPNTCITLCKKVSVRSVIEGSAPAAFEETAQYTYLEEYRISENGSIDLIQTVKLVDPSDDAP